MVIIWIKKKRILIIDEAWQLMKYEDSANFIYSLSKRARKYNLGITTITQDVEDFLKSPYGTPMLTNSSIQILLKQSPTSIDLVQKTFNLTDEEKYLLLESDVGEGIFFAGLKHVAINIIASYTEDQIITSDPSVKGILINIFGGIMRCDIIAEGVVAAVKEVGLTVPLVVRLEGTNVALGKQIINESGLNVIAANDLSDAADKIVKAVRALS